jgi:hypothetical protein
MSMPGVAMFAQMPENEQGAQGPGDLGLRACSSSLGDRV